MRRGRLQPLAIVAVFLALAAFQLWNRQGRTSPGRPDGSPVSSSAPSGANTAQSQQRAPQASTEADSRLDVLEPGERVEVAKTLALIARGGPFLHRQDGTIFSNREGQLPERPRGYYREYTVETAGAETRGARRIVRGEGGETYYTRDHYRTFVRIE